MGLKLSRDTSHRKSRIDSGTGHPKAVLGELIAYAVPALYITVFLLAVYDFYSVEHAVLLKRSFHSPTLFPSSVVCMDLFYTNLLRRQ